MKDILERVKREPALIVGLVSALIALALAFGFTLTDEQVGGIMAVVVAVLAVVTRSQVTPNVSVAAKENLQGEVVTGKAAPPEGEPAAVVHEGGVDLEAGAFDSGLLVALACIVLIICGIVWLVQAL